jgi:hypothetical protein
MGLESATSITGLDQTWPPSGDPKSQGDDHLRLIKKVLQLTFPNASKPFYFPSAEVSAVTMVLDATDYQNTLLIDTSSGNITVTLPAGLVAADKGFWIDVVKTTSDTNAVIVSPPSGTILSKSGSTATIRVGVLAEPSRFLWTGAVWLCFKYGAMIGTVASFDGATTPPGYLDMDGSTYSNTAFAELFAVLATTTLRDRRGRSDVCAGTGSGLTARVAGTNYGNETQSVTIVKANLPAYTPAGTLTLAATVPGTVSANNVGTAAPFSDIIAGGTQSVSFTTATFTGTATTDQLSTPISIGLMQPVIGAKKVIRAC